MQTIMDGFRSILTNYSIFRRLYARVSYYFSMLVVGSYSLTGTGIIHRQLCEAMGPIQIRRRRLNEHHFEERELWNNVLHALNKY